MRIKIFDYPGKSICTREVYCKHMQEETNRIKNIGKVIPWYVDPRPKDKVWIEDSVKLLKGAGGAKVAELVAAGIART